MTTVLSKKGQLVLPVPVREQLQLEPGDDFEVAVEDGDTITLRRISKPPNHGLVDLLLACPASFEIPARERDDSKEFRVSSASPMASERRSFAPGFWVFAIA